MPYLEEYFSPAHFTATRTASADFKSRFAIRLARFIAAGFPRTLFHTWFYEELSNCFGHSACNNRDTFYYRWCATLEKRIAFIDVIMRHPCYGHPSLTFSDVERKIQAWARDNQIHERLAAAEDDPSGRSS